MLYTKQYKNSARNISLKIRLNFICYFMMILVADNIKLTMINY